MNAARLSGSDKYGIALMAALAGYALAGKGFAYLGAAPLYVTEVILAGGLVAMLRTGCITVSLLTVPSLFLATLMVLTVLRTVPYVSTYGFDALRDSVLVLYGLFAFTVASLLLRHPDRLVHAVRFLRWFTGVFAFLGPGLYLLSAAIGPSLPTLPGSNVPIISVRAGELGVHLSACAVMGLLGLRSNRLPWICALVLGILVVASQNRGGLLAIIIPVALAMPFTPAWRRAVQLGLVAVIALGVGYAVDLKLPSMGGSAGNAAAERSLGARQVVDNTLSMLSSAENTELDDTKMFRLMWWRSIREYTFGGPYFWTGKGFGVNLAVDDGFVVGDRDAAPLRSPHNSHMTVLARTGVPGLVIWGLFLVSWFATMMSCAVRAWFRHDMPWGNLMFFIACYWLANLVDASFDVALEGPMLGVWFWSLTGLGLGTRAIYSAGRGV